MKKSFLPFCVGLIASFSASAQYDFGVTDLAVISYVTGSEVSPDDDITIGDTLDIAVSVTNFGSDAVLGTTIYFVYDVGAGTELASWEVDAENAPFAVGETVVITLIDEVLTADFAQGAIDICFATDMADGDPDNDQTCQSFNMVPGTGIVESLVNDDIYFANNALNYQLTVPQDVVMTIYNLNGQAVDQARLLAGSTRYELAALQNGFYMVQLQSNEGTYVQRMVKY